jgi:phenylalanyl-tRNA synthetase alpha chain
MNESPERKGHLHPITQVTRRIASIFDELGFEVAEGPEIEEEFYNFDALNIPGDHPARDMWDTFYVKSKGKNQKSKLADSDLSSPAGDPGGRQLLRTHTSPVQIRYMLEHKPPIRIIAPGKTFRQEATDATHEAQFYQIEGLMIDEKTSLADLKGVLENFFEKLFGTKTNVRLRANYFPFVEPGVEVDMSCFKCGGAGCNVCKHKGWIEIMGAGMVHPKVLQAVGIDPRKYQGFAFGGGIDRLAMLKFGIDDVRLFYNGDLRVINQF